MAKEQKTSIRYSISFRQKIIREIEEEGLGISLVARRYGIRGGGTIQRWLKLYGKNYLLNKIVRIEMKDEKDRVKELEAEVRKLKIALADKTMEKDVLETIIQLANDHYKTDVKKNLDHQLSAKSTKKKGIH